MPENQLLPTKPALTSKTIWANLLMMAGSIAAYAGTQINAKATVGAIIFGIVGIALRTVTGGEIKGILGKD